MVNSESRQASSLRVSVVNCPPPHLREPRVQNWFISPRLLRFYTCTSPNMSYRNMFQINLTVKKAGNTHECFKRTFRNFSPKYCSSYNPLRRVFILYTVCCCGWPTSSVTLPSWKRSKGWLLCVNLGCRTTVTLNDWIYSNPTRFSGGDCG